MKHRGKCSVGSEFIGLLKVLQYFLHASQMLLCEIRYYNSTLIPQVLFLRLNKALHNSCRPATGMTAVAIESTEQPETGSPRLAVGKVFAKVTVEGKGVAHIASLLHLQSHQLASSGSSGSMMFYPALNTVAGSTTQLRVRAARAFV